MTYFPSEAQSEFNKSIKILQSSVSANVFGRNRFDMPLEHDEVLRVPLRPKVLSTLQTAAGKLIDEKNAKGLRLLAFYPNAAGYGINHDLPNQLEAPNTKHEIAWLDYTFENGGVTPDSWMSEQPVISLGDWVTSMYTLDEEQQREQLLRNLAGISNKGGPKFHFYQAGIVQIDEKSEGQRADAIRRFKEDSRNTTNLRIIPVAVTEI